MGVVFVRVSGVKEHSGGKEPCGCGLICKNVKETIYGSDMSGQHLQKPYKLSQHMLTCICRVCFLKMAWSCVVLCDTSMPIHVNTPGLTDRMVKC